MAASVIGPVEGFGILGAGQAFPALSLSNLEVLQGLPAAAWRRGIPELEELEFLAQGMGENLGVARRNWAHRVGQPLKHGEEETTLDLAERAARVALADAKLDPSQIRLVLVATSMPHRMTSPVAAALGWKLGVQAPCMDVRTGCAGGLFAFSTAALYFAAGVGPALVVGTDTFSKILPPTSPLGALAMADGAGALIVGARPGASLRAASMETDGSLGGLISTDGAMPPTVAEIERGGYWLGGSPDEFTAHVPERYQRAISAALERAGLKATEIDAYVPHQASKALFDEVCRRTGLVRERTFVNVHKHANVGAAGWLVAVGEARAEGRLTPGTRALIAAVGGGMSWAAAVLQC